MEEGLALKMKREESSLWEEEDKSWALEKKDEGGLVH